MLVRILIKLRGVVTGAGAIIVASAALGVMVDWHAEGVARYSRDWLMRARGVLAAPDDIAIVAIDEPSLRAFGRFPWPRSVMARVIDQISAAHPKVIAIDVLYSDRTSREEDQALAQAIGRAKNVVTAAHLVESLPEIRQASWLLPIESIARVSAAVGHVNVSTESEGVARELLLRCADDNGRPLLAMPLEIVRVGDRRAASTVTTVKDDLLVGSRRIAVEPDGGEVSVLHASRMLIDYIGPAGAFAANTYSLSALMDGNVPASALHGRYVLIGATAASMGDRVASPFVHDTDAGDNQHGSLMPGVEVLANALHTILRSRFYTVTPDGTAFLAAALTAAVTLGLLQIAQGRLAMLKQIAVLSGVSGAVLLSGYVAFTRFLVFPPLVAQLVSFASARLLGLVRRSLLTSKRLDESIAGIARASDLLAVAGNPSAAAEFIAALAECRAVAIFAHDREEGYTLIGSYGLNAVPKLRRYAPKMDWAHANAAYEVVVRALDSGPQSGRLVLAHETARPPTAETLQLCAAIASGCTWPPTEEGAGPSARWPQALERKARRLSRLSGRIVERTRFVDLALRSVEDGLIIAGTDGRMHFVNRRAAAILQSSDRVLIGANLLDRLAEYESVGVHTSGREMLQALLVDRTPIEREIATRGARPRQYILRLAPVSAKGHTGPVLGIVASLSDITRQQELQQTKNDVISLVSHEMRTPLTAIQGISEVLANYELDPQRRREMNLAINDEVKRLTRMITEYLDITRLESGATVLRRSSMQLDALLERALLLLDPLAAAHDIRLVRNFAPNLPALSADSDLLARAVTNLVSNAIKYSPPGTHVVIAAKEAEQCAVVAVIDEGPGISPTDQSRVFDKFYRVPRMHDADVPGTGLGLALVREIAELHGGSVAVQSGLGRGSTFTIRIPLVETDAPVAMEWQL